MLSKGATNRPPADFDLGRLDACLKDALPDLDGDMALERIAGGQSNPTYVVTYATTYDTRRLVLRKKPAGAILPSAHAIDREYRVLAALAPTDVPVPRPLFYHEDSDVVGTPFYVMEHLDGRVIHDSALPYVTPSARRALYRSMAETLARLHGVDWTAAGLGEFGRHGGYFARQIARWTRQWELSRIREAPDIDRLIAWLPKNIPEDEMTTVVHGDFRFGNLMLHATEPRVVGVLDWELSTLGHPLADLAHCCICWHVRPDEYGGLLGLDLDALGLPSEDAYVAAYYRQCGHGARMQPFHLAFALFRFAVIFEGIAARARAGNAAADNAAQVGRLSASFARRAVEIVDGRPHA